MPSKSFNLAYHTRSDRTPLKLFCQNLGKRGHGEKGSFYFSIRTFCGLRKVYQLRALQRTRIKGNQSKPIIDF